MNYLDELALQIRHAIPRDDMPEGDPVQLFRIYAVLLLAKGLSVTSEDVHNAWVAWMTEKEATHPALTPFSELPNEISEMDQLFVEAIHLVASQRVPDARLDQRLV